jgi:hypothetical protein
MPISGRSMISRASLIGKSASCRICARVLNPLGWFVELRIIELGSNTNLRFALDVVAARNRHVRTAAR